MIRLLSKLNKIYQNQAKLNKGVKKIFTQVEIPQSYNNYLSKLIEKQQLLDKINSNISQKSMSAAQKYVVTGYAKPLTKAQQDFISRAGSDFIGQYVIVPSGLQKALGKVQINKIKYLDGKIEGVYSLLPVKVGQTTSLYSPKKFITENSNKPSIFGFYPEHDLDKPVNSIGSYISKYDISAADPSKSPISPLYTIIHERTSHGTDNLMQNLKVSFRWKKDTDPNPVRTVQEHYQKLVNDIVSNNPKLNIDDSKLWYELRATDNEITARAYAKVFKDAKKSGKIPQDASINDAGVIESLRPAYEKEIDKLTPESLAKVYASVNGYGHDYAQAIYNSMQKASSSGNSKDLNIFVDNLKSGIKYLPATIPIVIGGEKYIYNQYKIGGKLKVSIGKSGINIKKENKGKFTSYCGGTVTQACIDKAKASGNSTLLKRAVFAENVRKWKHRN